MDDNFGRGGGRSSPQAPVKKISKFSKSMVVVSVNKLLIDMTNVQENVKLMIKIYQ